MEKQQAYLVSLGRTLAPFCSKKQLAGLIKEYETKMADPGFAAECRPPRQVLSALRRDVDFYKSSTLRISIRFICMAGILCLIPYGFYFVYQYSGSRRIHWPFVYVSMCIAAAMCLWYVVNGGALCFLYRSGLQQGRGRKGFLLLHALYLLLAFGAYGFLRHEALTNCAWFAAAGITGARVGNVLDASIRALAVTAVCLLLFSLANAIRKSVLYYTVSCHSLLFLYMLFLVKNLFSSLGSAAVTLIPMLDRGILLYAGFLALYTAAFFGYRAVSRMLQKRD